MTAAAAKMESEILISKNEYILLKKASKYMMNLSSYHAIMVLLLMT